MANRQIHSAHLGFTLKFGGPQGKKSGVGLAAESTLASNFGQKFKPNLLFKNICVFACYLQANRGKNRGQILPQG